MSIDRGRSHRIRDYLSVKEIKEIGHPFEFCLLNCISLYARISYELVLHPQLQDAIFMEYSLRMICFRYVESGPICLPFETHICASKVHENCWPTRPTYFMVIAFFYIFTCTMYIDIQMMALHCIYFMPHYRDFKCMCL